VSTSSSQSYFDLHITGLGYLNRIREVQPRKGTSFLACDIAALTGPSNAAEYRRFDVKVSGRDAQHLIRKCEEAVKAERKVLIGFRLGDLWTDIFTYTKGDNKGKPGVSLKARLLFVSWIKVDGEMVYKAESKVADGATNEDSPATSEGAPASEPTNVNAEVPTEAPALAMAS
jgi:Protein of unknown function (DUF3577)